MIRYPIKHVTYMYSARPQVGGRSPRVGGGRVRGEPLCSCDPSASRDCTPDVAGRQLFPPVRAFREEVKRKKFG